MDMSNDFSLSDWRLSKKQGPALTCYRTRGDRADTRGPVKSGDSADGRLHYEDAPDGASRQGNCGLVACRGRRTGSVKVEQTAEKRLPRVSWPVTRYDAVQGWSR